MEFWSRKDSTKPTQIPVKRFKQMNQFGKQTNVGTTGKTKTANYNNIFTAKPKHRAFTQCSNDNAVKKSAQSSAHSFQSQAIFTH